MTRSDQEMIRFQADNHFLIETADFKSREEYVLFLLHTFAYCQVARLAGNKSVLDLGCNTGFGTHILAKSARNVIGVDISRKAIDFARDKYADLGIEFRVINGEQLPFDKGEFDIVASLQVIEHVVGYEKYLREIKKVLSPKGFAVFTTPNSKIRLDPGMKPLNPFHHHEFSANELKTLLEKSFTNVGVLGLMADEDFYSVEFNRVQRVLKRDRFKRMLPKFVLSILRKFRSAFFYKANHENTIGMDQVFIDQTSIGHFYYLPDNLDSSLDLLAICSDDRSVFEDIQRKFQENLNTPNESKG
jgi:2-polyprenyl-3-methyl-5-hydroxy-6-metoxy-1,4-benzoquinol methylase